MATNGKVAHGMVTGMLWMLMFGFMYFLALMLALMFLSGAAQCNERWDRSNERLWRMYSASNAEAAA